MHCAEIPRIRHGRSSHGGFHFTGPGYVQIKNPIGKLHYIAPRGNVSVVIAKIGYPTGIAFDAERHGWSWSVRWWKRSRPVGSSIE